MDSAFFDKRSKFIHYLSHLVIINNFEFDHADIFHDLTDMQRTFPHLTRIVPRQRLNRAEWKRRETCGSFLPHSLV